MTTGTEPKPLSRRKSKSTAKLFPRISVPRAPPAETMSESAAATAEPSEAFLNELQASWARHGAETIEKVRSDRPQDYLRLMASILPKLGEVEEDPIDAMSDDEVADELRRILDRLGEGRADAGAEAGAAEGA